MLELLGGGVLTQKTQKIPVATPKSVNWGWVFLGFSGFFLGFLNFQIGIGFFWVFWDWVFLGFSGFFLGFFWVFFGFFKFPNWGWVFLDFFGIGFFWFFFGFFFFLDFLGFLGFLKIPFMIFHWIIRFPIGVGFFLPHLQPYFWILAFFDTATRQGMQP